MGDRTAISWTEATWNPYSVAQHCVIAGGA